MAACECVCVFVFFVAITSHTALRASTKLKKEENAFSDCVMRNGVHFRVLFFYQIRPSSVFFCALSLCAVHSAYMCTLFFFQSINSNVSNFRTNGSIYEIESDTCEQASSEQRIQSHI